LWLKESRTLTAVLTRVPRRAFDIEEGSQVGETRTVLIEIKQTKIFVVKGDPVVVMAADFTRGKPGHTHEEHERHQIEKIDPESEEDA
jgi:hypothetical protein